MIGKASEDVDAAATAAENSSGGGGGGVGWSTETEVTISGMS